MKPILPVFVWMMIILSSCGSISTDSYIEVYGDAYYEPLNNNLSLNLYFNGSSERLEEFKKWLNQVISRPERRRIQHENYFYSGMYGGEGQEFQVSISFFLTFDNPDELQQFTESVINEKFPVSLNTVTSFEFSEEDLKNETDALIRAKTQAIEKISGITGKANPQIISFRQIRQDNFQEYAHSSTSVKVTVLVKAKK